MKINKGLLLFLIIPIIFFVAKLIGVIQIFIVPTAGSEPTLKANSLCLGTNLLKPKKFDFVIFKQNNSKYPGGYYCQRLIGEEGDKIQIKNGELFLNNKIVDNSFTLSHAYLIESDYYNWLILNNKKKNEDIYPIYDGKFLVQLSEEDFNSSFKKERYLLTDKDTAISNLFHHDWNADNFGPIIVPAKKIFTLGDNRNASLDSRYLGFIDKEDIHGKMIFSY